MRNRWVQTLTAGQRWPDASQAAGGPGGFGRFNWLKVMNSGANPVDVLPGPSPSYTPGDLTRAYCTVPAGTTRVLNLAGPKDMPNDVWWRQVFLQSALGTTFALEVSDHPIQDHIESSTVTVGAQPATDYFASGSVTTPAALTTICSVTPPAGTYDVTWSFAYGATGDVAANLRLFWNGGAPNVFNPPNPGGANAAMPPVTIRGLQLSGTQGVGMENIAAGASGAIYAGSILVQPAGIA